MKRIRPEILFLLIAVFLFGCATGGSKKSNVTSSEEGRYYETAGKYSIYPPESWQMMDFPGLKYKVVVGPSRNDFAPNVNFADEAFDGPLDVYVNAVIEGLKKMIVDVEIIERTGFTTLKNEKGEKLTTLTTQQGQHFFQVFYIFPGDGIYMVAAGTVRAEFGEEYSGTFDRILETFEWTK